MVVGAVVAGASLSGEGLGKDPTYYFERLGMHKSSERVEGVVINMPFQPMIANLEGACVSERYQREDLTTDVLYDAADLAALWVALTLKQGWDEEKLREALSAYGSRWERVESPWSDGLRLPLFKTHGVYRSAEGVYAWHLPEARQVILYSKELIDRYRAQTGGAGADDATEARF